MDKITKSYRISEISNVINNPNYNTTIKIYGSKEGSTKCLDISPEEYLAIRKILINGV